MSASIHISHRHSRWQARQRSSAILRAAQLTLRWGLVLASLLGTIAAGIYTQVHDGAFATWLARDFSAVVYAAAWCLGLALLRPTARPRTLLAVTIAICVAIELSQLWHPHWLEVARATLLGRLALGSTFMWSDLAYYAAGAASGALWLRLLPFRTSRRDVDAVDFVRPMGVAP